MASPGDRLSCQELVELVSDYLEGALPPRERARFEAHLDGCPGCRIYVAQMRQTLTAVRATAELDAGPARARGLLEAFRDWTPSR